MPFLMARSRYSSCQFGSLATSATITRFLRPAPSAIMASVRISAACSNSVCIEFSMAELLSNTVGPGCDRGLVASSENIFASNSSHLFAERHDTDAIHHSEGQQQMLFVGDAEDLY